MYWAAFTATIFKTVVTATGLKILLLIMLLKNAKAYIDKGSSFTVVMIIHKPLVDFIDKFIFKVFFMLSTILSASITTPLKQ